MPTSNEVPTSYCGLRSLGFSCLLGLGPVRPSQRETSGVVLESGGNDPPQDEGTEAVACQSHTEPKGYRLVRVARIRRPPARPGDEPARTWGEHELLAFEC